MGSVIPLKKSANSAYLELKNLLSEKLQKVEELIELKLKSDVNLIEQMSEMYISHQTAQTNNTLDFLSSRSDSVFMELEIAEEEFAKVKDINQRIVKASGRLKELQLMRNVEVLNTMYLEIVKNLEISKLTLLNQTPIIQIIDKPILPLEVKENSKILLGLLAAFLGGFLSLTFFVFRKLFKDALSE